MSDPSFTDPDTPNSFTVLRMSGVGVPPYSARGLTQTLAPISQASQNKRTINGSLKDISFPGFDKYKSTISGNDQKPPNVDGIWPGQTVVVDCISELQYTTIGGTPQRSVVSGSLYVEGNHTLYRPQLTMRIIDFSMQTDEYGAQVSWSMDLEEI
jgi:hypothetical protein